MNYLTLKTAVALDSENNLWKAIKLDPSTPSYTADVNMINMTVLYRLKCKHFHYLTVLTLHHCNNKNSPLRFAVWQQDEPSYIQIFQLPSHLGLNTSDRTLLVLVPNVLQIQIYGPSSVISHEGLPMAEKLKSVKINIQWTIYPSFLKRPQKIHD